jgi:hypothetical protein
MLEVYLDVQAVTGVFTVAAAFNATQRFDIDAPGIYHFSIIKDQSYSSNALLERMIIRKADTGVATSITLNEVRARRIPLDLSGSSFNPNADRVQLGLNAIAGAAGDVALGPDAITTDVSRRWAGSGGLGLGAMVAVGDEATAHKSRTTSVGAYADAIAQSSTAIGFGAFTWAPHQLAIGRNARGILYYPGTNNIQWSGNASGALGLNLAGTPDAVFEAKQVYFGNGGAHINPPGTSAVSSGSPGGSSTSDTEWDAPQAVGIHGADAHDARFPAWSSTVSYNPLDIVWRSNKIYQAITSTNLNNAPESSATNWRLLFDDTLTSFGDPQGPWYMGARGSGNSANVFNVPGGDLQIYAGRGTGTGIGGDVEFLVSPPALGTEQNTKNPTIVAGRFTGQAGLTSGTRFYLVDIATGLERQVKIGPAGSGPGGVGKSLFID